jgi:MFS family permease
MSDLHPHYRRNFASLMGDWVFFVAGMAFLSYTSVIPSFVNHLTNFAPLIGMAATIPNGVWLLPQLVAAKYIGTSRRKKPWVIAMSLIGRPLYVFVGLTTFLAGNRNPLLLLSIFFLAETVFSLTDGLSSVAWFDVLGKVIPARRRGRFYSAAQATTGLLSMAVGVLVARILGPGGPPFPQNYGLLFCSCSALLLVSLACFTFIKEPVLEVQRDREPWGAYLPRLSRLFAEDEQMRTINLVRLLVALGGLALPFYVVHATDVVGVGNQSVGLFVSAQMLGSVIASLAMGYLNERSGSRVVSQLTVLMSLSSPILALAIHYAQLPGAIALYVYALVFFFIGGSYAGYMQGFMNFVLDIAPMDERTAYVGLYNTLGGTVVFVAPLLGGWLLESTSYPVLFTVATAGTVLSLLFSVRLKEPRLGEDRQR